MSPLRIALFTSLSTLVLYAINAYARRRIVAGLGLGPRGARRLGWGLVLTVVVAMGSSLLDRVGASPEPGALRWLHGPSWTLELSLLLALPLFLVQHAVERVLGWRGRAKLRGSAPSPDAPASLESEAKAAALTLEPALAGAGGSLDHERTLPCQGSRTEPAAALGSTERAFPSVQATSRGEEPPPPRRQFLLQVLCTSSLAVSGGASAFGALVGRSDYALETVVIPIPGLPANLEGFSLVQLSDIHVGAYTGPAELEAALDLARDARAHLAVLTGDLIDHDKRMVPRLQTFLEKLRGTTEQGVAAIPGNHDYYAGVDEVLEGCRAGGTDVLLNRHRLLGSRAGQIALVGVDDVFGRHAGRGPDLARATAGLAPALPKVLLCHNPSFFAEAAGNVALQLSGHTHGGQVNPLFRPADYVLPQGWVRGRYDLGGSVLYVNRGFGTVGPPARLLSPPEVTKVVLVRA